MRREIDILKRVTGIFRSSTGLGRCHQGLAPLVSGDIWGAILLFAGPLLCDLMTSRSVFCSDLLTAGFFWLNQNLPVGGASKCYGV